MACTKEDLMFAISERDDWGDKVIQVHFNVRQEWEDNQRLTDSYREDERELVNEICDEVGLSEDMESTYGYYGDSETLESLKDKLIALGIEHHRDFQDFIDSCEW